MRKIEVATATIPDWFYVTECSQEQLDVLRLLPGTRILKNELQVHASIVRTQPDNYNVVYDNSSSWFDYDSAKADMSTFDVLNKIARPYQVEDANFFLSRSGGIQGSEVGVGKTLSSALAAQLTGLKPVLVMGTLLSSQPWCSEKGDITKFFNVSPVHLQGRKGLDPTIFEQPNDGWWYCHYDILEAWIPWIFTKLRPRVAIFDEVHKISPTAKRGKAALAISRFKEMKLRIVISATPVRNKRIDLWMPMELASPGCIGERHTYGLYFCLPGDAPITMSDFTEKQLSEIKIGDTVLGWKKKNNTKGSNRKLVPSKVKNILVKESELQKVIMSNGDELICTPDHKWLNGIAPSGATNEYMPIMSRIPKNDHGYKNNVLVKFNKIELPPVKFTTDYQLGYLYGIFCGDGTCFKTTQTVEHPLKKKVFNSIVRHAVVLGSNDYEIIERTQKFLKTFNLDFKLSPPKSDKLWRLTNSDPSGYNFFKSKQNKTNQWMRGYLGGMYDAEGSYRNIYQNKIANPISYKNILDALNFFKFKVSSNDIGHTIKGGREEFLRFWSLAQPVLKRKLISFLYVKSGKFLKNKVSVKKIIPLPGKHKVYTLTTETGNYVAYNYGSRNCDGQPNQFGGWDYNGETHNEELKARLSYLYIRRTKADVMSYLPPIVRQGNEIELPETSAVEYEKYKSAEQDIRQFLKKFEGKNIAPGIHGERLIQLGQLLHILSKGKANATAELAGDTASTTGKCVVFCWFKDTAKAICKKIESMYEGEVQVFGPVTGEDPVKTRIDQASAFAESKVPSVYVATLASASESINELVASQELIINDLYWNPLLLIQAEGRLHRGGQTGSVHVVYVTGKDTIDVDLLDMLYKKASTMESLGVGSDSKQLIQSLGGQAPDDNLGKFIKAIESEIQSNGYGLDDEDEFSDD